LSRKFNIAVPGAPEKGSKALIARIFLENCAGGSAGETGIVIRV
jgi:hypothetical protein